MSTLVFLYDLLYLLVSSLLAFVLTLVFLDFLLFAIDPIAIATKSDVNAAVKDMMASFMSTIDACNILLLLPFNKTTAANIIKPIVGIYLTNLYLIKAMCKNKTKTAKTSATMNRSDVSVIYGFTSVSIFSKIDFIVPITSPSL